MSEDTYYFKIAYAQVMENFRSDIEKSVEPIFYTAIQQEEDHERSG